MNMIERARVSAAVALAVHGIPTDVQEMLLRGDGRGTVLPGALDKVVSAILRTMRDPTPEMIEAGEAVDGTVTALPIWQAMIDASFGVGEG